MTDRATTVRSDRFRAAIPLEFRPPCSNPLVILFRTSNHPLLLGVSAMKPAAVPAGGKEGSATAARTPKVGGRAVAEEEAARSAGGK